MSKRNRMDRPSVARSYDRAAARANGSTRPIDVIQQDDCRGVGPWPMPFDRRRLLHEVPGTTELPFYGRRRPNEIADGKPPAALARKHLGDRLEQWLGLTRQVTWHDRYHCRVERRPQTVRVRLRGIEN